MSYIHVHVGVALQNTLVRQKFTIDVFRGRSSLDRRGALEYSSALATSVQSVLLGGSGGMPPLKNFGFQAFWDHFWCSFGAKYRRSMMDDPLPLARKPQPRDHRFTITHACMHTHPFQHLWVWSLANIGAAVAATPHPVLCLRYVCFNRRQYWLLSSFSTFLLCCSGNYSVIKKHILQQKLHTMYMYMYEFRCILKPMYVNVNSVTN